MPGDYGLHSEVTDAVVETSDPTRERLRKAIIEASAFTIRQVEDTSFAYPEAIGMYCVNLGNESIQVNKIVERLARHWLHIELHDRSSL